MPSRHLVISRQPMHVKYDAYRCPEPTVCKQFRGWRNSMYVHLCVSSPRVHVCKRVRTRDACTRMRISQSSYRSLFISRSPHFLLFLPLPPFLSPSLSPLSITLQSNYIQSHRRGLNT